MATHVRRLGAGCDAGGARAGGPRSRSGSRRSLRCTSRPDRSGGCGSDRAWLTTALPSNSAARPSPSDWRSVRRRTIGRSIGVPARSRNSDWPDLPLIRGVEPRQRREAAEVLTRFRICQRRQTAVANAVGADTWHADAGPVMLDLDDCVLAGPAMTDAVPARAASLGGGTAVELRDAVGTCCGWSLRSGGRATRASACHDRLGARWAMAGRCGRTRSPPAKGRRTAAGCCGAANGTRLRAWSVASDIDLDATGPFGARLSLQPHADRATRAAGAQRAAGLLTNGEMLRLLLCDPSRADSHLSVGIDAWRRACRCRLIRSVC